MRSSSGAASTAWSPPPSCAGRLVGDPSWSATPRSAGLSPPRSARCPATSTTRSPPGTRCSSRAPPTPPSASCCTGTGSSTGTPTAGSPPAWPTTAAPRSPTGTPNARRRSSPTPRTGAPISPCCNGWARTWRRSAACWAAKCAPSRWCGTRSVWSAAAGSRGAEWLAARAVTSGRAYLRRDFHGHEVDHLYAPWLLHAGLSPDHAGGGLMTPLFAGILHGFGLPVVAGAPAGSWRRSARCWVPSACAWRRASRSTASSWSRAVRSAWRLRAALSGDRAVLASVTPSALYGRLLPEGAVDSALRAEAASFRYGRAALQIHVALSEPLGLARPAARRDPADPPLRRLGRHRHRVRGGGGGTSAAAPHGRGRPAVPAGPGPGCPRARPALWLQLQEVPFAPVATRPGNSTRRTAGPRRWPRAMPTVCWTGCGTPPICATRSCAIDVLTPDDLRDRNPNAVSGDPYGGSAELDQSLLWRPLASSGRHATPVGRLWHIGASTHPGAGLGGGSGHLVATTLTRGRAWRR